MSHFTAVPKTVIEIKREDVLRTTLEDLGFEIVEDSTVVSQYGSNPCDFKIQAHGIEIGFLREGQSVSISADWFDASITQEAFATELKKAYSAQLAKVELKEKGFHLVEEITEEGKQRLVFRRLVA